MANERQISNTNEDNQSAIAALGSRVTTVENTIDSSTSASAQYVDDPTPPDLSNFELTYSGYNTLYVQSGPVSIVIPATSIAGKERTFVLTTDASYSNITLSPSTARWYRSGSAGPGGDSASGTFSLIDSSAGGTQKRFIFNIKCLTRGGTGVGTPWYGVDIEKATYTAAG